MRELNSICLNDYEVLKILYQFVRPCKTVQCISAFEQLTLCLTRTPLGSAILDLACHFQIWKSPTSQIILETLDVLYINHHIQFVRQNVTKQW